jgi:hypothetical protein
MTYTSTENHTRGSVCVDCLIGLANGEWPEVGENWTDDQETHVREGLARYEFMLGHIADEAHPGEECDEDRECEHTTFSSSYCDLCNTGLAGSRDDVTIWWNNGR